MELSRAACGLADIRRPAGSGGFGGAFFYSVPGRVVTRARHKLAARAIIRALPIIFRGWNPGACWVFAVIAVYHLVLRASRPTPALNRPSAWKCNGLEYVTQSRNLLSRRLKIAHQAMILAYCADNVMRGMPTVLYGLMVFVSRRFMPHFASRAWVIIHAAPTTLARRIAGDCDLALTEKRIVTHAMSHPVRRGFSFTSRPDLTACFAARR